MRALGLSLMGLLFFGCTGTVDDGPAGTQSPTNPPPVIDPDNPLPEIQCDTVGPRLVRRLTAGQYRESLLQLFGNDPNVPDAEVLTDPARLGFHVDAREAVVRDLGAQQLMVHAEKVAAWAVEQKLGQVAGCQNFDDSGCRRSFIEDFGLRAYRHPLENATVDAYETMFVAEGTFPKGAEAVIATMLQSPHFLYRQEIGQPNGDMHELDAYELATNLAFTLTDAPPD
ncbi:MAG: DUF1595 domain-containing protein, partial [Myxococcota bacterium]